MTGNLSEIDKQLLAEITAKSITGEGCIETNEQLSIKLKCGARTVSRIIEKFVKGGYLILEESGELPFKTTETGRVRLLKSHISRPRKQGGSRQMADSTGGVSPHSEGGSRQTEQCSNTPTPYKEVKDLKIKIKTKDTKGSRHEGGLDIWFNKLTGQIENITDRHLEKWNDIYPDVNIKNEISKAVLWLAANPHRRHRSYERFLVSWFSRCEPGKSTRPQKAEPYTPPKLTKKEVEEHKAYQKEVRIKNKWPAIICYCDGLRGGFDIEKFNLKKYLSVINPDVVFWFEGLTQAEAVKEIKGVINGN